MPNNDISVDEFIKTKILLPYQPIAQAIRGLIRKCAPRSEEVMSYGIPSFRINKILAVISPTKTGITLAFSRGAEFKDEYGLLEGVGKISKNVRMSSMSDYNEKALIYYIQQAVKIDEQT